MDTSRIDKGIKRTSRIVEILRALLSSVGALLVGLATFAKNWWNDENTQKSLKECIKECKELRDEVKSS